MNENGCQYIEDNVTFNGQNIKVRHIIPVLTDIEKSVKRKQIEEILYDIFSRYS